MNVLIQHVDRRIASLLDYPEMWGGHEAVELQVILLLEVRALAVDPDRRLGHLHNVRDSFVAFLQVHFPDSPPVPLAILVAKHPDSDRMFVEKLQAFARLTAQRQTSAATGSQAHSARRGMSLLTRSTST